MSDEEEELSMTPGSCSLVAIHWHGQPGNLSPLEHAELGWFHPSETTALDPAAPELSRLATMAVDRSTRS